MVQFCCVVGCGNRSNREFMRFFRLPSIKKRTDITSAKAELLLKRRRQWLENIARVDLKDGDSNYSPGYIRVCSDHFIAGEPSELTDVDHPDWAPTLKMGHGQIRMKGNLRKRIMLGFPLPDKMSSRKKKNTRFGKIKEPTKLTILVEDPDESEVEQRKMLAVETECAEKKKKYKPVKNPYAKRRKKPPPEIKRQQMQARRQQIRMFMQRKKQMYMKQTMQKRYQGQTTDENVVKSTLVAKERIEHWFSGFLKERPSTVIQNASDRENNSTDYVSPLIHKITKAAVVVLDGDDSQQLDTAGESNSKMMPVNRCDQEPLYNNIKREDEYESLNNSIKRENYEDEPFDDNIKSEDYEDEPLSNSTYSENGIQFVYPSADEERLLQELMNGHLREMKTEIKLESDEV